MSIKVGFVGLSKAGWASSTHGPILLQLKDKYTLSAISTSTSESATASASDYSTKAGHTVKAYHGSTSSIASDPDVNLVAVSVKAPNHLAAVLPVIDAGKDLFVEWPAGKNLAETKQIAEAAKNKGIRTIVGLQGRQSVVLNKIKEIIASGKIGRVLSSNIIALCPAELMFWGPKVKENNTYVIDGESGATMLDIAMGHQLDMVTYVLGDFKSISATSSITFPTPELVHEDGTSTGKSTKSTAEDHVSFTGLLKSGALASVMWRAGQKSTPGRRQLLWEIDGDEGSIRVDGTDPGAAFAHIRDPNVYVNNELLKVEAGEGNIVSAWTEFAKGNDGKYATIDDALKNRTLLDAISRSAKEGKRVEL